MCWGGQAFAGGQACGGKGKHILGKASRASMCWGGQACAGEGTFCKLSISLALLEAENLADKFYTVKLNIFFTDTSDMVKLYLKGLLPKCP